MANEAVIVELFGQPTGCPIRYTCADGVQISGNTLLWASDPRTVSGAPINGNDGTNKLFAGIAATEKVANDGSVTIGVYTKGIFDLTTVSSPANIVTGDYVVLSGLNLVAKASTTSILSGATIVGRALEDASASEVIQVAVGVYN